MDTPGPATPAYPCPDCGGTLYFFEPQPQVRVVKSEELPSACQQCQGIFLGQVRLQLPANFEKKAVNLAIQADAAAKDATAKMKLDPELRVERYIGQVFKSAYMTGFFRAMAFYQHQAKEGRLVRLTRLWAGFKKFPPSPQWPQKNPVVMVEISEADYHEFDLLLRVKESSHVEGAAHAESSRGDGEAPVPGPTGEGRGGRGPVE